MAYDKFYIADLNEESGIQRNVRPFLIPDKAFSNLENAYVFRGRVRKRFGSRWLGNTQQSTRLRIAIGTIQGGNFVVSTFPLAALPAVVGQAFSVLNELFTINALGNPAPLLISGATVTATFDTTVGTLTIAGSPAPNNTPVYFYPGLPVMGLLSFQDEAINEDPVFAFDTRFAYQYVIGGWERINAELTVGAAQWAGTDSQFFWGETWTGDNGATRVFFVTNFNENEPMRKLIAGQWSIFQPAINATDFLFSARIVVAFKNRLLFFNTWEGAGSPGINYQNRCRYSQIGSPLAVDAFRSDIAGKGNAIDASTTQAIITVEFVKDRLIVFFEQSTWELVYTGNQAYPFSWQQINGELGAESTFSIVPFDKVCIGVGNVGIMACSGANVERIDAKIPDEVFDIHNVDQGIFRVYGVRDYFVEMIYWTFPDFDATEDQPYPNRVLVYNYATGTWAFNDDSITVFGYYQATSGISWDSETVTWDDDVPWDSGQLEARFRSVIAGNQEGYVFIIDPEMPTNAAVLQITDMVPVAVNTFSLTVINHNLRQFEYVYFQDVTGNGNITLFNGKIFQINFVVDRDTFLVVYQDDVPSTIIGVYSGNGVLSRVSNITINTKEYNFYADSGRNASINQVNFLVDATGDIDGGGRIQVDYFTSTSMQGVLDSNAGSLIGTGTLDTFPYDNVPYEQDADRLWHSCFINAQGNVISLELSMNDEQMKDPVVRESLFTLHAMLFVAKPCGRIQ